MSATPIVLGYWDIRGLVQPAILMLEYAGANYEVRRMNMSKPDWFEYKPSLGFDFPNLPFLEEGDIKITQSKAIFKHLGRKFGLCGSSLKSQAEVDMMLDVASEYLQAMTGLCYRPDFSEEIKQQFINGTGIGPLATSLNTKLTPLNNKLGSNDWFVGNELTIADFVLWETLDAYRLLFAGCLDALPGLTAFMERFSQLKGVKQHLQSPTYRPFPIWSVRAKYGYHAPN